MVKGKVALVTGASGGIGACIVKELVKNGVNVAIHYNNSEEKAEKLLSEIEASYGINAKIYKCDIRDNAEVKCMIEKIAKDFGHIDFIVNNAGVALDAQIIKMPEAYFDDTIAINVKGTWNTIQHALPYMIEQGGGSIVNISSIAGVIGNFGQSAYASSKAAVLGMTKTIAKETATKGIRVNAVAPGFIEVGMSAQIPDKLREKLVMQIPMQRQGKGEEIAKAVLFLLSDEASYITGQTLEVNGGMNMN